jgi:lipopolysaccharide export system protein LptA
MNRWIGLVGAVAALGCAAGARAQVDTRSGAPIDITADQAEVVNSECLAIWRGAAEALQGQTRLRAHTISVYAVKKGLDKEGKPQCGGTQRIVADGDVYYVTPQQRARSDHAVYSQGADEIVMTGNVIVVQGKDVARGERLVIKISTKESRMESGPAGSGGRVRGVFYPDTQNPPASAPQP